MEVSKVSSFYPFELKIKIETEDDAKAIFAVFNLGNVIRVMGLSGDNASGIRKMIGEQHYVGTGEIAHGITAEYFYKSEE